MWSGGCTHACIETLAHVPRTWSAMLESISFRVCVFIALHVCMHGCMHSCSVHAHEHTPSHRHASCAVVPTHMVREGCWWSGGCTHACIQALVHVPRTWSAMLGSSSLRVCAFIALHVHVCMHGCMHSCSVHAHQHMPSHRHAPCADVRTRIFTPCLRCCMHCPQLHALRIQEHCTEIGCKQWA